MKIKAKLIRATEPFQAVKDCREYLCGFNVSENFIQATNGHCAIQMDHQLENPEKGIYKITGKIPAKAEYVDFIISKAVNCVRFLDFFGEEIGVTKLKIIEGNYPNIKEKILNPLLAKSVCNLETPRVNPEYVGFIAKAFKIPFIGVDFEFRGINEAIIAKIPSKLYNDEFGNPVIIIMPIKK